MYVLFGATGGICSERARQLHASGGRLLLVGRSEEQLQALAASLPGAAALRSANAAAAGEADATALERYGCADGVANCIRSVVLKAAHSTSDAELASSGDGCGVRGGGSDADLAAAMALERSLETHPHDYELLRRCGLRVCSKQANRTWTAARWRRWW